MTHDDEHITDYPEDLEDEDDACGPRRAALLEAETKGLLEGLRLAQEQAEAKANPLLLHKERARKIRRILRRPEKPSGDLAQSAADHARMLDVSFRSMMLDGDDTMLGEKDAIYAALRTQQQFVRACYLLKKLEEDSSKSRQTRRPDY